MGHSTAQIAAWHRTAASRLRLELAGLAFACRRGFTPEDYARHLWGQRAVRWMGKDDPTAEEYLLKEVEAFRTLYPKVSFLVGLLSQDRAELAFTDGCLGGWGRHRWAVAQNLGLTVTEVCRYCSESFTLWAGQLGFTVSLGLTKDETCTLVVTRSVEI
ncbi:MAG: hypothetical protein HY664_07455 [Chloroflexi bacterium]|nr:hypothetical protein [Chloroflexota bacterium]